MYNHQKTKNKNRPHWWFHDFSWWFCLLLEIMALFVRPSFKNLGRPFGPAWDLGPWGTFQRAVLQSGLPNIWDLLGFHQQEYGKYDGNMYVLFTAKWPFWEFRLLKCHFNGFIQWIDANGAMKDIRRPQVYQTFGEDLNIAWTSNPIYLRNYVTKCVYYAYMYIYICIKTYQWKVVGCYICLILKIYFISLTSLSFNMSYN